MESEKRKTWNFLNRLEDKNPNLYFALDLLLNIAVIVVLVFTVRTYLISPFQVYGPSMCNTMNFLGGRCQDGFGEYLIVNKALYRMEPPQRGDIIVFRPPHNESEYYIKRDFSDFASQRQYSYLE